MQSTVITNTDQFKITSYGNGLAYEILKPDYYFKGDACKWTGKTSNELDRLWYHYEILEGARKGDIVLQTGKPYSLMNKEGK